MTLSANRFLAVFLLLLSWAVGLSFEGTIRTIIMLYGAKAALFLWFLPQIKAALKALNEWRLKNGIKTWNESRKDEEEA
jgi:hypothetical protein